MSDSLRYLLTAACLVLVFALILPVGAAADSLEAFWDDVLDYHGTVMLLIDTESGRILAANQAAQAFYGYSEAAMRRMRIEDLNTLSPEQVAAERRRAAASQRNYFVFPHRVASGEIRTVEVHSWPTDDDGSVLFSIIHDVTQRLQAQETLIQYNQRLTRAESLAQLGHWELHFQEGVAYLSEGAQTVLGVDEAVMSIADTFDLFVSDHAAERQDALDQLRSTQGAYDRSYAMIRPVDGEQIYIRSAAEYDAERDIAFGTLMDITEYQAMLATTEHNRNAILAVAALAVALMLAVIFVLSRLLKTRRESAQRLLESHNQLSQQEQQLQRFMNNIPGIAYRCLNNPQWTMLFVSGGLVDILGYHPDEMTGEDGHSFAQQIHEADRQAVWTTWQDALEGGKAFSGEYRVRAKDGAVRWVLDQGEGVWDADGRLLYLEGLIIDITSRKQAEEQLEFMSFHDTVTGLKNRTFMEQQLTDSDEPNQLPLGLVMVDVNGLKMVNDSLGHRAGDEMLQRTAKVLERACPTKGTASRWGGDEFLILLPATSADELNQISQDIINGCASDPDDGVPLSAAVGFALKQRHHEDLQEVLATAEDAMYQQKMSQASSSKNTLVASLQRTLAEKSHETEEHARRLQTWAVALARELSLPPSQLNEVALLALLHDIGKVAIPEAILNKPGPLSKDEKAVMDQHPEIGYRIAAASPDLAFVAEGIRAHHERWDGAGYPRGLRQDTIPLAARIVAIVDAFEAMTSQRPYRDPIPTAEAVAEIAACSGSQFDPALVQTFLQWYEQSNKVQER